MLKLTQDRTTKRASTAMTSIEKTASNVIIKPMTAGDVPELAEVLTESFARDPGTSFGETDTISTQIALALILTLRAVFVYPPKGTPAREKAVAKSVPRRIAMLNRQLCNPGSYVLSAIVDGRIAGFSMWSAPIEQDPSTRRFVPLHLRVWGKLYKLYDRIIGVLYPSFLRRILDPLRAEQLRRRSVMVREDGKVEEAVLPEQIKRDGHWTLNALGVSEEFGRRGIGSKLLQWGIEQADNSGHAVMLAASEDGAKLYARHGFKMLLQTALLRDEADAGTEGIWQGYMLREARAQ